jgi:phosphonate transport system substrate-binding protein
MFNHTLLAKILSCSLGVLFSGFISATAFAETYWVGITPWQKGQTEDDINKLYLPMMKWLSDQTGHTFKIKPMASYEGTIEQISQGKIQVGMLSPAPYVKAKRANPKIELLVTELSWNHDKTKKSDSYKGHILVKKDRDDLATIESLKGKWMAFVSLESTSGYKVPMLHLKQIKIDPKTFFAKTYLLGSHPAVTDAIAAGSVDAGATWDFNWQQAIAKNGDIYKAIWSSEAIPNLCVIAHPDLPAKVRTHLKKLLPKIPDELLTGLSSVGFVEKPDSFYDSVRRLED